MTPHPYQKPELTRRRFLKGTMLAGSMLAVGPALAACGGDEEPGPGTGPSPGNATLPTYTPITGITPDLLGDERVENGYLTYPDPLVASVRGNPMAGGSLTALILTFNPPPPPVADNPYWQAVNDRLGASYEPTLGPAAEYAAKLATTTSGSDDLPDLVLLPTFLPTPRLPELLESRFANLTEHLQGDAVNDYPNLANLPPVAWRNVVKAGQLWGVPLARPPFVAPLYMRQDIIDQVDADAPANADDFLALCTELTDAAAGRWAIGGDIGNLTNPFLMMFGAPNGWRENSDGTLTRDLETEEFAEAIAFMARLWEAGVVHPDTPTMDTAQLKEALGGGRVAMTVDGVASWPTYYNTFRADSPEMRISAWVPVGHDGGEAPYFLDTGAFGMVSLKQADTSRVEELLRALDFFCAPFGSEEYHLLRFGVDGVHNEQDAQGGPVRIADAAPQFGINTLYLGNGPYVLFNAAYPDWVQDQHAWEKTVAPTGIGNPTVGLYSETEGRVGATLESQLGDTVRAVMKGDSPVSAITDLATSWRNGGGDAIREEYQEALAATS